MYAGRASGSFISLVSASVRVNFYTTLYFIKTYRQIVVPLC